VDFSKTKSAVLAERLAQKVALSVVYRRRRTRKTPLPASYRAYGSSSMIELLGRLRENYFEERHLLCKILKKLQW